jgi:heat shock protein HtpX
MARRRRRRELFPADRGLQVRMVVAAILSPAVAIALVVLLLLTLDWKAAGALALVTLLGVCGAVGERRKVADAVVLEPGQEPELQAIVDRLCVAADLPRPEIAVDDEAQPNSWIVDAPGRPARLHVTRGLLDLLTPQELEGVIAHELSHVANRDATVMTVVGLPSAALMRGAEDASFATFGPLIAGRLLAYLVGFVSGFGSVALSRHRELTADAGAARLTGRPAALASALMKVSGALAVVPAEDLRVVAARDGLHLVATGEHSGKWFHKLRRLHGPSHPSVERRVAALERQEHRAAHGRGALSA